MFTYFTLPVATTTLSGVSEWFNPWFEELWPWAQIVIGISLVFFVIAWIVRLLHKD